MMNKNFVFFNSLIGDPRIIAKNDFFSLLIMFLIFSFCSQIRYTGFRDRPQEERQIRFQNGCRAEGRTEVAFVASGTNLQLTFNCNLGPYGHERECDFDKEHGKVCIPQYYHSYSICKALRIFFCNF